MREKILAQLVAKHPGVSKKALGLIADKLAKKVTEESGIEQAITDFDNAVSITEFAADLQREGDSRVSDAKKEWEKKNPKKDPKADDPKDDPVDPTGNEPEWLKGLTNQLKTLGDQVATMSKEKAQTSIKAKATELLKDVPESFWDSWTIPDKEDGLQAFVDSVTEKFSAFQQTMVDKGLMSATQPGGSSAKGGAASDKVVDAEIKEWADKGKDTSSDKK